MFINFLNGENFSNHGLNINTFVNWKIVEPIARQFKYPNPLPDGYKIAVLVQRLTRGRDNHIIHTGAIALQ